MCFDLLFLTLFVFLLVIVAFGVCVLVYCLADVFCFGFGFEILLCVKIAVDFGGYLIVCVLDLVFWRFCFWCWVIVFLVLCIDVICLGGVLGLGDVFLFTLGVVCDCHLFAFGGSALCWCYLGWILGLNFVLRFAEGLV